MIFRFLEYDYCNEEDMRETAKFIAGISGIKDYDVFLNALLKTIHHDICICGEWYKIDAISCEYNGKDSDAFCINVYLYKV